MLARAKMYALVKHIHFYINIFRFHKFYIWCFNSSYLLLSVPSFWGPFFHVSEISESVLSNLGKGVQTSLICVLIL